MSVNLKEKFTIHKTPTNANYYTLEHYIGDTHVRTQQGLKSELECLHVMKALYQGFGELNKGEKYTLTLEFVE